MTLGGFMFSFISNQANKLQNHSNNVIGDEEIISAEAIHGDTALILKVIELNELRQYDADAAA